MRFLKIAQKKECGHTSETARGGGVTAPLREGVTNAWLPFPSNADLPTVGVVFNNGAYVHPCCH
jgi:hypothetical protein